VKAFGRLLALAALGLAAFSAAAAQPGPRSPAILMKVDDPDEDSLPRSNVNFRRIQYTIAEQLSTRGFKVHEEMDEVVVPDRTGRQLPDMMERGMMSWNPIDVILLIQVHAAARPAGPDLYRPSISVEGRFVLYRSGRDAGNTTFGQDIELPTIAGSCAKNKECLHNSIDSEMAKAIGMVAGNGFATTLATILPPQ
jgi:hypothetical protein